MTRAKKSLGQHWLNSPGALKVMIDAAELTPHDTVLEIGPGTGVLTAALLTSPAKQVIAVEKDDQLVELLRQKFATNLATGRLQLIHADILELDLHAPSSTLPTNYKLIANLPYYLTGQILRQFLESANPPERLIVMLQKEVVKRIVGLKSSLLSISVKAFGDPKYLKTVPAGSFTPAPKVDSAILGIFEVQPFAQSHPELDQRHFFELLHRGFAHKRKLLRSNLGCPAKILLNCGLAPSARAEDLTLNNWLCLAKTLF